MSEMSEKHVVVGAGAVGRSVARHLAGRGEVLLVSRSGAGPDIPGAQRVGLDVTDVAAMSSLAAGATALYNCINPPSYDVWPAYWPPAARAFLIAAERSGAVLATASCLYAYGRVDQPMVEGAPDLATGIKGRVRAGMWADVLALHREGRIRALEVRAADFMGLGVVTSHIGAVAPRALKGRAVRMFGRVDVPHSMTDVRDLARTLVAAVDRPEAWGRVWHAPTNPARSQSETVADVCRSVGRPPVRVRPWPGAMLGVGGVMVPFLREMRETVHQFEAPYVLDSDAARHHLGLAPTPWDEVCRATAETALAH